MKIYEKISGLINQWTRFWLNELLKSNQELRTAYLAWSGNRFVLSGGMSEEELLAPMSFGQQVYVNEILLTRRTIGFDEDFIALVKETKAEVLLGLDYVGKDIPFEMIGKRDIDKVTSAFNQGINKLGADHPDWSIELRVAVVIAHPINKKLCSLQRRRPKITKMIPGLISDCLK